MIDTRTRRIWRWASLGALLIAAGCADEPAVGTTGSARGIARADAMVVTIEDGGSGYGGTAHDAGGVWIPDAGAVWIPDAGGVWVPDAGGDDDDLDAGDDDLDGGGGDDDADAGVDDPTDEECSDVTTCQDRGTCMLAGGEAWHICPFEVLVDGTCDEETCDSDDDCDSGQPGVAAFCTPYEDGSYCTYLPIVPEDCDTDGDEDFDGDADCADADCAGLDCDPLEICGNQVDDDLDGAADCFDDDCPCVELCDDDIDDDHDGATDCEDLDCTGAPGCPTPESCGDGVDNDLDDEADCADPDCLDVGPCATPVGCTAVDGLVTCIPTNEGSLL